MQHRAVRVVSAIVAIALGASSAFAKAPPEQPTIETIFAKAQAAIKAKSETPPDPAEALKAQLEEYRDPKKTPLAQYEKLTGCIRDPKADNNNRLNAADFLVERFKKEPDTPEMRATRRAAVLSVLDMMKADAKDETGLRAIDKILNGLWPAKTQMDLKWHWNDKPFPRAAAWKKMKAFLDKGDG